MCMVRGALFVIDGTNIKAKIITSNYLFLKINSGYMEFEVDGIIQILR